MIKTERCFQKVLPFWENLTGKEQNMLLEHSVAVVYPKGGVVFNPIKKESGVRIVMEGQIRIFIQTRQGSELLLDQLGSDELCLLSLLSLMTKFNWDIYMEALQKSQVVMIPEHTYLEVSKKNQEMELYNNQVIFQRLAEAVHVIIEHASASTEQRTAGLLLRYREMEGKDIFLTTHERMARDIGTVREVVSRLLKQFEAAGLVELQRGKVTVVDAEGLEKIKQFERSFV